MITENLKDVEARVCAACERSGRKREDVTLIAVSKTKPVEMLEEAYAYGCRYFGENKVQELCDKYEQLPKDLHWHLIGHLQRNKVKYIVDKASMQNTYIIIMNKLIFILTDQCCLNSESLITFL